MEKAFSGPYVLAERLGHVPDAAEIAGMDEATLVATGRQVGESGHGVMRPYGRGGTMDSGPA